MTLALWLLVACGSPKARDSDSAPQVEPVDSDNCGFGYADADIDGYPGTWTWSCSGDLSETQDDCDDRNAAVNPAAVERCDTAWDDDCDGDTNDPDATGCTTWYTDKDTDGYGSSDALCLCDSEAPYTASVDGDCDDTRDAAWPGEGRCGLWGDLAWTDASATLLGPDADQAFAAWNVAMAGDVDGDGLGDLVVSSPYGTGSTASAGSVWIVAGVPSGESSLEDATATIDGEADWWFGWSITGPGDLDGDGYADVLVGARGRVSGAGAAWFLPGPLRGALAPGDVGIRLAGEEDGETATDVSGATTEAGEAAAWIVGRYDTDSSLGAAFLMSGVSAADGSIKEASSAAVVYFGAPGLHNSGLDGRADIDGDGVGDLVLGSPHVPVDEIEAGAAYLLLGPFDGVRSAEDADLLIEGTEPWGEVGSSVAFVGDNDGDGLTDVMVGAQSVDGYRGEAAWFAATRRGTTVLDDADAAIVGTGSTPDDDCCAGAVVAGVGDQDQDGLDDVAVPISGDFAAYLFAGPIVGTLTGDDASGRVRYNPDGVTNLYGAASSVAVGDINGDGWPDVLFGSHTDEHTYEQQGTAYLFMGGGA